VMVGPACVTARRPFSPAATAAGHP
jgi:hypothetical protein